MAPNDNFKSFNFNIASFNCNGIKSAIAYVEELDKSHQITFVCEHWLHQSELVTVGNLFSEYKCFLKSIINPEEPLKGCPHGGIGLLCKDTPGITYNLLDGDSLRSTSYNE